MEIIYHGLIQLPLPQTERLVVLIVVLVGARVVGVGVVQADQASSLFTGEQCNKNNK
jgi:hypothetical protein